MAPHSHYGKRRTLQVRSVRPFGIATLRGVQIGQFCELRTVSLLDENADMTSRLLLAVPCLHVVSLSVKGVCCIRSATQRPSP